MTNYLFFPCMMIISQQFKLLPRITSSFAFTVFPKHNYNNSRSGSLQKFRTIATTRPSYRRQLTLKQSSTQTPTKKKKDVDITNSLKNLPKVYPSKEIVFKAAKETRKVEKDTSVKNIRNRVKKYSSQKIDTQIKSLCLPCRDIIRGYKSILHRLHPFEEVVVNLTLRARQKRDGMTLDTLLNDINEGRKMVLEYGKEAISYTKNECTNSKDIMTALEEYEVKINELFLHHLTAPLLNLVSLQRALRMSLPSIQFYTPAVVLIGAPNVGKSSIVRRLSSASPEVNNYPFTTRGMTVGHIDMNWDEETLSYEEINLKQLKKEDRSTFLSGLQKCQIMDTPGLLVREDGERNEMEMLTLATMQHLPTAVMYVLDFSGGAGDKCSSIEDQLALREEVRSRFPKRPWVDVISKVDLGIDEEAYQILKNDILSTEGDKHHVIELSITDDIGVDELKTQVKRMLEDVRIVLDAMANVI